MQEDRDPRWIDLPLSVNRDLLEDHGVMAVAYRPRDRSKGQRYLVPLPSSKNRLSSLDWNSVPLAQKRPSSQDFFPLVSRDFFLVCFGSFPPVSVEQANYRVYSAQLSTRSTPPSSVPAKVATPSYSDSQPSSSLHQHTPPSYCHCHTSLAAHVQAVYYPVPGTPTVVANTNLVSKCEGRKDSR